MSLQLSQAAPAVAITLLVCAWLVHRARQLPYPPGPKPAPFFGHVFQVPKSHTWRYFTQLAKEYGSVVRLTLAGDDILVLNSSKDAEELVSSQPELGQRCPVELTIANSSADGHRTIRLESRLYMLENTFQLASDSS